MPWMLKTTNVISPSPSVVARLPVTAPPSQTISPPPFGGNRGKRRNHAQQVRVEDEQEKGEAQEVELLALCSEHRLVDFSPHVLDQGLEEALQPRGLRVRVLQLAGQVEHAGQHQQRHHVMRMKCLVMLTREVEAPDAEQREGRVRPVGVVGELREERRGEVERFTARGRRPRSRQRGSPAAERQEAGR